MLHFFSKVFLLAELLIQSSVSQVFAKPIMNPQRGLLSAKMVEMPHIQRRSMTSNPFEPYTFSTIFSRDSGKNVFVSLNNLADALSGSSDNNSLGSVTIVKLLGEQTIGGIVQSTALVRRNLDSQNLLSIIQHCNSAKTEKNGTVSFTYRRLNNFSESNFQAASTCQWSQNLKPQPIYPVVITSFVTQSSSTPLYSSWFGRIDKSDGILNPMLTGRTINLSATHTHPQLSKKQQAWLRFLRSKKGDPIVVSNKLTAGDELLRKLYTLLSKPR